MAKPDRRRSANINGRRYDETAALSDQGVEIASGKVIVVAKKDGFGQDSKEVTLAADRPKRTLEPAQRRQGLHRVGTEGRLRDAGPCADRPGRR